MTPVNQVMEICGLRLTVLVCMEKTDPCIGAGCQVIVPDQRGYNLSDKPTGVKAYRMDELANDVIGLIDALGYEKVNLVGHDWGAAVAWVLANKHPECAASGGDEKIPATRL